MHSLPHMLSAITSASQKISMAKCLGLTISWLSTRPLIIKWLVPNLHYYKDTSGGNANDHKPAAKGCLLWCSYYLLKLTCCPCLFLRVSKDDNVGGYHCNLNGACLRYVILTIASLLSWSLMWNQYKTQDQMVRQWQFWSAASHTCILCNDDTFPVSSSE